MKIGIRGHDLGAFSPEELVERYVAAGVETVQLAIPKAVAGVGSYFAVDDRLLARIGDAFRNGGVSVAVLGCYIEPSLEDEAQRERQVETFRRGIYCAAALGAGCIGTETTNFSGPETDREAAYTRLCRSLESMLAEAGKQGVTVAVEPVAVHTLNTPERTRALLDRFAGSGLRAIFDPVNLLTAENYTAQDALWPRCTAAFGGEVVAMHIKDCRMQGGVQQPCLLGEGVMEYAAIAAWLREKQPETPLLREEIAPATAARDLAWMRETLLP